MAYYDSYRALQVNEITQRLLLASVRKAKAVLANEAEDADKRLARLILRTPTYPVGPLPQLAVTHPLGLEKLDAVEEVVSWELLTDDDLDTIVTDSWDALTEVMFSA